MRNLMIRGDGGKHRLQAVAWLAATGVILATAGSPVMAQVLPEDRLCTADFNADYGWFNVPGSVPADDRLGVLEFPGALNATCVPATTANLTVKLGVATLPLVGDVTYDTFHATVSVPLLEPALCEDYFSGTGAAAWALVVKDANGDDMMPTWGAVDSIQYNPGDGALDVQRANGSPSDVRCYAGLKPNFTYPPQRLSADLIFSDSMESPPPPLPDLQVEFMEVAGNAHVADELGQANGGGGVTWRLRVRNLGLGDATNVRIREFVPGNAALLGPTVTRDTCTVNEPNGVGCSNGVGTSKFAQDLPTLAAGTYQDYILTRTSSS
ncbi:MAG: hypothetical protein KDI69_10910, partial [Xanthomonadales bacterium]|nr:hypothetical protein [Xanthomonadales bacterium]